MKSVWMKLIVVAQAVILLVACAGNGQIASPEQRVERGGKMPGMVKEGELYEFDKKRGLHRFVGLAYDVKALDTGQDVAEADAMSRLVQAVNQEARREVLRSVSGPEREEVGRFYSKTFAGISSAMPVSGAASRRVYWERYVREEFGQPRDFYRVWIIVEIPDEDFRRAKAQLLTEMARQARIRNDARAEALSLGALERLTAERTR